MYLAAHAKPAKRLKNAILIVKDCKKCYSQNLVNDKFPYYI